jgi:molybdopterin synthase catalytic subunit
MTAKDKTLSSSNAVRIQEEDFSVEEECRELRKASTRIGGIVSFIGVTRDFSEGQDIESIEFDQYASMALKATEEIREKALIRFDIIEVRIVHRVARIPAGEQIVLIVVGAEHRKEAFNACEWCIDTLKETVPLWKKEITPDGESWVTPHP